MRWLLGITIFIFVAYLMRDLISWSLVSSSETQVTSLRSESVALKDSDILSSTDGPLQSSEERPALSPEDLQRLVQAWQSEEPAPEEVVVSKQERSNRSLDSIQLELNNMPPGQESAAARSFLLNSAAQLNLDDEDTAERVHELAMRELFEAPENNDAAAEGLESFSSFLPVVAHEVALKTAFDAQEALQITLMGLDAYQDPLIRSAFVQHFTHYFPQEQRQLYQVLAEQNLSHEGL